MGSELQSLEASFFVHATEDEERVVRSVRELLGTEQEGETQEVEGHFGNPIHWVRFHLTGEEGLDAFRSLVSRMPKTERDALLDGLGSSVDEHRALYIRLSKQRAVLGEAAVVDSDPIRVKVKPRAYLIRGDATEFYSRLIGGVPVE